MNTTAGATGLECSLYNNDTTPNPPPLSTSNGVDGTVSDTVVGSGIVTVSAVAGHAPPSLKCHVAPRGSGSLPGPT